MLHWLLPKWLKKLSLEKQVLIFSLVGHLFALFSLLVLYKGASVYNVVVTSTMIQTDVPIVFLPLHKSIKQSSGSGNGSAKKNPATSTQTKITQKKEAAATTIITEPVSKKQTNKSKNKKKQKNKKEKKQEQNIKKEIVPKKIDEPIKPVEVLKVETQEAPETSSIQAEQNLGVPATDQPAAKNVLYVGQAEMEALQVQEYIQQEMAQHWSPPAGIRSDAECILKVIIGHDGEIAQIIIEKTSGILLFDGAARRAASQLQPPQWAYGKELAITFKP